MTARNSDVPEPRAEHPFFHTMVLMGSALALGCGGMSEGPAATHNGTGGTGAGRGSGGSGGSGTAAAGASGGSGAVGGTGIVLDGGPGSGGTGGTGSSGSACAATQWNCDPESVYCSGRGFQLPNGCPCDDTRPDSAESCGPGESFVCRQADSDAEGRTLATPVPFGCACVPTPANCETACDGMSLGSGSCVTSTSSKGVESILCGCAPIVLR